MRGDPDPTKRESGVVHVSQPSGRGLSNKQLFDLYIEIINSTDLDRLDEVIDPDYLQIIPQSGEVLRGLANMKALLRAWPGGERFANSVETPHIVREEREYVVPRAGMMPYFSSYRVDDHGDTLTGYAKSRYPDGSEWYVVTFVTIRNHKVVKQLYFFAPLFDPPEWRLPFVEIIGRDDFDTIEKLLAE